MILALAYVILSAKRISIRRLLLLYIFLFGSACCVLTIFGMEHATKVAWRFALVITLFVWAYPIVRVLRRVSRRQNALEVFQDISIGVQATYGFAAAILFIGSAMVLFGLTFAAFTRLMVIGLVGAIGFPFVLATLCGVGIMHRRSAQTPDITRWDNYVASAAKYPLAARDSQLPRVIGRLCWHRRSGAQRGAPNPRTAGDIKLDLCSFARQLHWYPGPTRGCARR
jgi:hypothetical protein